MRCDAVPAAPGSQPTRRRAAPSLRAPTRPRTAVPGPRPRPLRSPLPLPAVMRMWPARWARSTTSSRRGTPSRTATCSESTIGLGIEAVSEPLGEGTSMEPSPPQEVRRRASSAPATDAAVALVRFVPMVIMVAPRPFSGRCSLSGACYPRFSSWCCASLPRRSGLGFTDGLDTGSPDVTESTSRAAASPRRPASPRWWSTPTRRRSASCCRPSARTPGCRSTPCSGRDRVLPDGGSGDRHVRLLGRRLRQHR